MVVSWRKLLYDVLTLISHELSLVLRNTGRLLTVGTDAKLNLVLAQNVGRILLAETGGRRIHLTVYFVIMILIFGGLPVEASLVAFQQGPLRLRILQIFEGIVPGHRGLRETVVAPLLVLILLLNF